MKTKHYAVRLLTAAASLVLANSAFAGQKATPAAAPSADKWQFHLFNPTPTNLMREMSTDRPDQTESPYTVDAGHIQIEMDFVSWTRDNGNDDFAFANTNFKIGLLNNVDLQIVLNGFNTLDGGGDGWGDLETRLLRVAEFAPGGVLGLLLCEAQLNGVVAVVFDSLDLDH